MNLNGATIKALPIPPSGNRVHFFGGAVVQGTVAPKGFGVRVTAGGARSFILSYTHRGREHRITIGQTPPWNCIRAVREARELRIRIDRGENPLDDRAPPAAPENPTTVNDLLDAFMTRYANRLRSADGIERALNRLVRPVIGDVSIYALRRSQIASMLDRIEDESGPVMADRTLAYVRKAFNWWATRDDQFNSPIVKGMARTKPLERARTRVLSDDELRLIWAASARDRFGAFVRLLLLTGQRRGELAAMRKSDIDKDGVWTIRAEDYKTKRPHFVPLSRAALVVIDEAVPFPAWWYTGSRVKRLLDSAIAEANGGRPIPPWTVHDLRRTAKTLMVRSGVRPDISERVLGHVIHGVEGIYDRHSYLDEKRDALERLAAALERILNPAPPR
jgi:integrase